MVELQAALEAIRAVELAYARGEPYEVLLAGLDACAALDTDGRGALGIAQHRVGFAMAYERPCDERAAALREYLALQPVLSQRVLYVAAVAAGCPHIMDSYRAALIAEVRAAQESGVDDPGLEHAWRALTV